MKKLSIILPFMLLIVLNGIGQNMHQKIKFSSVNQISLLSGDAGQSFAAQTINGIRKDKWFAGAGVGLDLYNDRSIPLFLDIRREFCNKPNTPFVYADAGINYLWLNYDQKAQKNFPSSSPGLYYDFGIGWKLSGNNKRGILFSAGYTYKQVKEKVNVLYYNYYAPIQELQPDNYERYNYLYRRLVLKIGFQL